jgi:hypothetical protein
MPDSMEDRAAADLFMRAMSNDNYTPVIGSSGRHFQG